MIKPLLITSLCAFLAAAGFFSLAAASGVAHGGGEFWRNLDRYDFDSEDHDGRRLSGHGPQTTRTVAWPGGDLLDVAIGADVTYTQGPTASLVITGPKTVVEHIVVRNGRLTLDAPMRRTGDLRVVMTAPDVKRFILAGSHDLIINGYKQDRLEATLAGSGDVAISGTAERLQLTIAGSGDIDAGALSVGDAAVSIAGSGDARISPTKSAEINIAGSGDVHLTTQPPSVKSNILGSGSVTS